MSVFGRMFYKSRKFYDDDFDWDNYTADSYERRLKGDVETAFEAINEAGDLSFDPDTGKVTSAGKGIHPNRQVILETIGILRPGSVHEVGCGAADHVASGAVLFPDIAWSGADRSEGQLALARRRHPQLARSLSVQDLTMPFSRHWPRADFVYSQTVLMHIHTAVSHFVAISNMVATAKNYVLMMENQQCHNFVEDIQNLWNGGHLPWDSMYLYLVEGSTGARAILLSRVETDYPLLHSDAQLRDGLKPSARRLKRAAEDSARGTFGKPRG